MSNLRWLKIPAALLALALAIVLSPAQPAQAQPGPEPSDVDLPERYAPVLYFHPDELYRPQPVEVMIGAARLRQARSLWADATVLRRVEPSDLERYTDSSYSLDVWLGYQVSSDHRLSRICLKRV